MRTIAAVLLAFAAVATTPQRVCAQAVDLTVFAGLAYPLYDERLTIRPGDLSIPGVEVTSQSSPVFTGNGGAVFGAALGVELGVVGLEGRFDSIGAAIDFSGVRYDLRGTTLPFQGLTATIAASPGRFEAERISVLSVNARIRTPGRINVVASGGLSYLPDLSVSGSVPLTVDAPQLPPLGFNAGLTLRATPGQDSHRFGVNGGAGIRFGGPVAVVGEVRAFYFREYELRLGTADGPQILDDLLAGADPVRFRPLFLNAQVGLAFRF